MASYWNMKKVKLRTTIGSWDWFNGTFYRLVASPITQPTASTDETI